MKKSGTDEKIQKQKRLYKAVAGIIFAIQLLLIWFFYEGLLVKWLYNGKNYLFVEATFASYIVFFCVIAFHIILLLYFYDKKVVKKDKPKAHSGISANFIKIVIIIALTAVGLFYSFSNITYIGENGFYDGKKIRAFEEIKDLKISAEKILSPSYKSVVHKRYAVCCTVEWDDEEIRFISENFYGYESVYEFLKYVDKDLIEADKTNFDDLIRFEKESLRFISSSQIEENIRFIELVRDLATE